LNRPEPLKSPESDPLNPCDRVFPINALRELEREGMVKPAASFDSLPNAMLFGSVKRDSNAVCISFEAGSFRPFLSVLERLDVPLSCLARLPLLLSFFTCQFLSKLDI
jgi:hypothetical protein